jgi:hypothetical protein
MAAEVRKANRAIQFCVPAMEKVIVERCRGDECGEQSVTQAPQSGDDQDEDKEGEGHGGGIYTNDGGIELCDNEEDCGAHYETEDGLNHRLIHEQGL